MLLKRHIKTESIYKEYMINMVKFKNTVTTRLAELINWALNPYNNGLASPVKKNEEYTVGMLRKIAKKTEHEWGNKMINQNNNGNWTTSLGENLVRDVLRLLGKNPKKTTGRNGYKPDWECDDAIYEVKTRNWTTSGTAGEKVLGVHYKYSDIPIIYDKPLYIVCVAYQEYELTNGNTRIFGEDISERKREILEMAKKMDIHYIKFSDLVSPLITEI
tara:strand:- start:648 stop:1298 length:651 start_codon:yes stop_codon:yes gene_type:complete